MNKEAINKWVLLLLVFFISALFLSMICQFLMAIFFAGIFSALSYPLYRRFERWFKGRRTLAFELKSSSVPRVSKGFWNALDDISPDEAHVVAPVKESYPMKGDVMVSPLQEIIAKLQEEDL